MPNDLRALLKAKYDLSRLPLPSIAELCPITRVTAELRDRVSAAIRTNATSLRLSGNSVVEEIHKRHEEIVRELLERHQQGQLSLFLDTDGTDDGLRRMSSGTINLMHLRTAFASIEGKNGTLVGPVSILTEFAREFLVDRGYDLPPRDVADDKSPAQETIVKTGMPGRPTSWHLIEAECRRRYEAGKRHPGKAGQSRAEWASTLIDWLKATHPHAAVPTPKAVTNKLAGLLYELEASNRPKP